jgi:hypothetical protein
VKAGWLFEADSGAWFLALMARAEVSLIAGEPEPKLLLGEFDMFVDEHFL